MRPLVNCRGPWPPNDTPDLEKILCEVIETLSARDRKVTDKDGRDHSLRARSYRTTENKIDGAAITLVVDIGKKEPKWRQHI